MAEKVTFHLAQFDGPLDLLLHLLSRNRIEIKDIPIAEICAQYLEYLERMRTLDIEVAGEFIAMASHLVYIKSKMLLPVYEDEGAEDPRTALIETLLDYQRVKQAGGMLLGRYEMGKDVFTRDREVLGTDPGQLYDHTADHLKKAIIAILERAGRKLPPPVESFSGIVGRHRVSVEDKITEILKRFRSSERLSFNQLVLEAEDRSGVVAVFLAVLEMSKNRRVQIEEENEQYTLIWMGENDGE
ncbi:MAG: segregation/condensation protein A [Clostridia bacterium]|nr:segregation/condensation protein A [Clostridia bacterium]